MSNQVVIGPRGRHLALAVAWTFVPFYFLGKFTAYVYCVALAQLFERDIDRYHRRKAGRPIRKPPLWVGALVAMVHIPLTVLVWIWVTR